MVESSYNKKGNKLKKLHFFIMKQIRKQHSNWFFDSQTNDYLRSYWNWPESGKGADNDYICYPTLFLFLLVKTHMYVMVLSP